MFKSEGKASGSEDTDEESMGVFNICYWGDRARSVRKQPGNTWINCRDWVRDSEICVVVRSETPKCLWFCDL